MKKKIKLSLIILAAGKGSRLNISTPKPLLDFCGKKLIDYPIESGLCSFNNLKVEGDISVIVNYKKELVIDYLQKQKKENSEKINFVDQVEPLGTGHAIITYFKNLEKIESDYIIVTCADTPLINNIVFEKLIKKITDQNLDAVLGSFCTENPTGYGRILKDHSQSFRIVEEKDASESQKKVKEVNAGVYIFQTDFLKDAVSKLKNNNSSKEYYLTDVFTEGINSATILFENEKLFAGANTLKQLEEIEQTRRTLLIEKHQNNGVRFLDSSNIYIEEDVKIARDVVISPNVHLQGSTEIDEGVKIDPNCTLVDSRISKNVHIKSFSHLENASVAGESVIGPYARLRPGSSVGENCKIGNFVEIKKSVLKNGAKVSHLSYIGDAEIGEKTNIGCGFITCNYDGKNKHKTIIGDQCFIGSDSQAIAPVKIGNDCFVASGTTICEDMPEGSFAISRNRQMTKLDMAKKFIKK